MSAQHRPVPALFEQGHSLYRSSRSSRSPSALSALLTPPTNSAAPAAARIPHPPLPWHTGGWFVCARALITPPVRDTRVLLMKLLATEGRIDGDATQLALHPIHCQARAKRISSPDNTTRSSDQKSSNLALTLD
ncbi:Hypothetical protein NTJ_03528 [Nesidiocoris tenuis]|uniref:Uncharacterized protein n=1 Tax=Nesidiocoris tenuis TaxID=355587 RepID=A0ABN7AIM3_9HEMI|nr:Hypothetical protein NTJ_03528 [Nesidiocoris tenuis]